MHDFFHGPAGTMLDLKLSNRIADFLLGTEKLGIQ
jgi:hypothetical protein